MARPEKSSRIKERLFFFLRHQVLKLFVTQIIDLVSGIAFHQLIFLMNFESPEGQDIWPSSEGQIFMLLSLVVNLAMGTSVDHMQWQGVIPRNFSQYWPVFHTSPTLRNLWVTPNFHLQRIHHSVCLLRTHFVPRTASKIFIRRVAPHPV